jgi:sugar lactone lactonase YvrE
MRRALHLLLCFFLVIGCTSHSEAQSITTIAGNGTYAFAGEGIPATLASFKVPTAISLDNSGNLYVADQQSSVIRRINLVTGIMTTIAGNGSIGYSTDGSVATAAKLGQNWGVAADQSGRIYITEQDNYKVRTLDASGVLGTLLGTGLGGYSGDNGAAVSAQIQTPLGIATDHAGNIFVCDQSNFVVRKVNTAGIVTTVAGNGHHGYSGDGAAATNASFNDAYNLATDNVGNLYICDGGNNCIRKVTPDGIISTVAGTGTAGYNGDNMPATHAYLNKPTGVCVDDFGNIFIADSYNNRVRLVSPAGIITTIAGTGTPGFFGDGGPAVAAYLDDPCGITVDSVGNVYFADLNNFRIRKINKDLTFKNGHKTSIVVCQDASVSIDSALAIQDLNISLTDTWNLLQDGANGHATVAYSATSSGGIMVPVGLNYTPGHGFIGADSFKVQVTNGIDVSVITVYVDVIAVLSYGGVINGPSYVCAGSSITLTDSTGNGTWSISNLNATVNNGVVTGGIPGTDTVRYTISNSCGSITAVKEITIRSLPPAGTISGVPAICIGLGTTFSETVTGGTWSAANTTLGIAPSGLAAGIRAGADTVYYTVYDGFCSNASQFRIIVDSTPFALLYPPDTSFCAGLTVTIADSPATGSWSSSNNNIIVTPHGDITGIAEGQAIAEYTLSNSCGTAIAREQVSVYPAAVVPTITQTGSVIFAPGGYSVYQWLLNGKPIAGSVTDSFLIDISGFYSIFVKNQYGCPATSPALYCHDCTANDIIVYPNPTASIVYVQWCKAVKIKAICEDGKTVELISDTNSLDLSILPDADYLIVVYDMDGKKLKTKKVTKVAR